MIINDLIIDKVSNSIMSSILQVATMTRSEITLIDSCFIGPFMLFLNQYFNVLIPEYFLLTVVCVSKYI